MGTVRWLDDDEFVIYRKAEVNKSLGHLSWCEGGPGAPAYPLPKEWPRCVGCDLTNDQDIIPALVVSPEGVALCREHTITSGHGGWGPPHRFLGPPCARCGVTVEAESHAKALVLDIGTPRALMVGYLCDPCAKIEYTF